MKHIKIITAIAFAATLAESAQAVNWQDEPTCTYHPQDNSKRCLVATRNANLSADNAQLLMYQCIRNPNNRAYAREFIGVTLDAGEHSRLKAGYLDIQGNRHYSVSVQFDNNPVETMAMFIVPQVPILIFYHSSNYMAMIDRILTSRWIQVDIPYAVGKETVGFLLLGAKDAASRALRKCSE